MQQMFVGAALIVGLSGAMLCVAFTVIKVMEALGLGPKLTVTLPPAASEAVKSLEDMPRCKNCGGPLRGLKNSPEIPGHVEYNGSRFCHNWFGNGSTVAQWPDPLTVSMDDFLGTEDSAAAPEVKPDTSEHPAAKIYKDAGLTDPAEAYGDPKLHEQREAQGITTHPPTWGGLGAAAGFQQSCDRVTPHDIDAFLRANPLFKHHDLAWIDPEMAKDPVLAVLFKNEIVTMPYAERAKLHSIGGFEAVRNMAKRLALKRLADRQQSKAPVTHDSNFSKYGVDVAAERKLVLAEQEKLMREMQEDMRRVGFSQVGNSKDEEVSTPPVADSAAEQVNGGLYL